MTDKKQDEIATEAKELGALLTKINKERPSPADVARVNEVLDKLPNLAWELGNLANQTELQIIENALRKDKATMLLVSRRMGLMRDEMGYEQATIIERGLIEHCVLCWLRLYVTELRYEGAMKDVTLAQGAYWEKKLSANQKRYLRAIETLARVRRLMQPAPSPLTLALVKAQIGVK